MLLEQLLPSKTALAKACSPGHRVVRPHKLPVIVSTLLVLLSSSYAQAQGFGTITPGGVQPQLERPQVPTTPAEDNMIVPPVIDRPLNIDDGPKIKVRHFQLNSYEDFPLTVKRSDILEILAKQRDAHPDGFTIGELQQAANEVTQYYREQGYILAQAFVPQQEVNNGIVIVKVLIGRLGKVSTANNQRYSSELLVDTINYRSDKPLQQQPMESALLRLNDLPGLKANGVFRPGDNTGETELVINVQEEKAFEGFIIADNYGVETTGKERLMANVKWNNLTGSGDQLSVTALQTFDPTDSLYGDISYERSFIDPNFVTGIQYNNNDYTIGQQGLGSLDVEGETEQLSVYGRLNLQRSRLANKNLHFSLNRKTAEVEALGENLGKDDLAVIQLAYLFDSVSSSGISRGRLSIDRVWMIFWVQWIAMATATPCALMVMATEPAVNLPNSTPVLPT
ncbi:hypothetical protein BST96_03435 [Oceanicoccus sagamiensis]|uniref:POTRA domain-containing protein n=2 Tax=Oceanicoccus sagamiensis TaxID=716816 RepID=A0A1X9N9Y6_9GAMM|nr:hypothetical protein BST96_03435 [Oceanicoccus sagamiensis]